MRHNYKGRKMGTSFAHRKAMKKNLVNALFLNDRIKTIETRAKEIRPDVDKIITLAKRGDLHARRQAIALTGDKEVVREVFLKVEQGLFQDREGGYTRIMKLGNRKGDNAPMCIMELCTEPVALKWQKEAAKEGGSAKPTKKATPKKIEAAEEATEEVTEESVEANEEETPTLDAGGNASAETEETPAQDEEQAEPEEESAQDEEQTEPEEEPAKDEEKTE